MLKQMEGKGKKVSSLACAGFSFLTGLLLIIGGILVLLLFRSFVHNLIMSKIPLQPGSQVTEAWINPPVRPLLQLYFFNTTNPAGFLRGEKPRLVEVGPYVYEEEWQKVNVSWEGEGHRVKYRLKKVFRYRQDLSGELKESDRLTLPNVPMFASVNQMKNAGRLVQSALSSMLEILKQEVFNSTSVRDIIWGYDHPLIKLGNDVLPKEKKLPFDKFGFFVNKNHSVSGIWETMTGVDDVKNVAKVISFDGETMLDFWGDDECNSIKGTDGSLFHPGVQQNETLYIFNKDLCQSLPLVFQEEVVHHGMNTFRFVPPANLFGTPQENPRNRCFCPNSQCPKSGLFNVSACQFGSPIMLSWPHFFQADPLLLDAVEGLHPSKKKHQFQIDILPKMGVGMRAAVKSQINLVMKQMDTVRKLKGVRDIIYPILWFTDGVEDLGDKDTISLLQTAIHTPEMARSVMYPTMLVVGILMVLTTMAFIIRKLFFSSPSPSIHPVTELDNLPRSKAGYGNGAFSYEHPKSMT